MISLVRAPRVNNNDDTIRLRRLLVGPGNRVEVGQALAEVETDKATLTVESDRAGVVLSIGASVDAVIDVGTVLFVIGDSLDEVYSEGAPSHQSPPVPTAMGATAAARALITKHDLDAAHIPARGERLTVEDVQAYLAQHRPADVVNRSPVAPLMARGRPAPLSMEERAMLRSVLWHRDEAVTAYLEIEFDPHHWIAHAQAHAASRRLLGDPLLGLMAHRLVGIAKDHPKLNSTIVDGQRHRYDNVNLGFTMQVAASLYLLVVHEAEAKDADAFLDGLNQLQRRAIGRRLKSEDVVGATLAFSSMARWNAERHVPILPPHVSMIVAHTVGQSNRTVIGATYDHRVLSGGDVVEILKRLSVPEEPRTL